MPLWASSSRDDPRGAAPAGGAVRWEVGQQMRQFREQGLETGAVAGQEVE